jgi:hypothetical protein
MLIYEPFRTKFQQHSVKMHEFIRIQELLIDFFIYTVSHLDLVIGACLSPDSLRRLISIKILFTIMTSVTDNPVAVQQTFVGNRKL